MVFENYKSLLEDDLNFNIFVELHELFLKLSELENNEYFEFIKNNNIHSLVSKVVIYARKEKIFLLNSAANSLDSNVRGLTSNMVGDNLNIKCAKIMLSYDNFEFASVIYRKLERMLKEEKLDSIDIIFAVGMANNIEKPLKIEEELKNIFLHCIAAKWIPICVLGCKIDIFTKYIEHFKFKYIHFSGHCNEKGYLSLVGSNVRPTTISNQLTKFNQNLELIFLNCCYTDIFYDAFTNKKISGNFIIHHEKVKDQIAIDFSDNFYLSNMEIGHDIIDSFQIAYESISSSDENYSFKCKHI